MTENALFFHFNISRQPIENSLIWQHRLRNVTLQKSFAVRLLYSRDRTVAPFSQLVKVESVSRRRRPLHDLRIMALKGVLAKFRGHDRRASVVLHAVVFILLFYALS